ncbi:MAG: serine/threonine-protein kinase [Ilumatobacteraceae bacterium]
MAQLLASRYEVGPLLGTGGMARVVRGRDTRLDRPVAIKLVPADAIDPAGRERFGREARSSAGFDHPNAVTAFDAGESDGYLFLVMELVDGSSLAELLATRGPLPFDEVVRIEDGMLAALGAAHAAGIVHRDVKPGNVLLDGHGRVKLADFGIARRLDDLTSDLTGVGRFIGTPKYLAPEQIAGDPATPATDLYAAGVVLYEMVAGAPPFDGPSPMELAWAHHHAPVPDVRVARPDVPPALAATISTAMAKDPVQRFATADAMRRARIRPPAPATPAAATALLAAPVLPPTVVGPASSPPPPPAAPRSDPGPSPARRRWGWILALAVLLAVAAAAIVLGRDDDPTDPTSPPTTATAVTAGTTATVQSAPTTSPPETSPPATTVAPETTSAPTEPPPTEPPPTEPAVTDPPPAVLPNDLGDLLGAPGDLYGPRTEDLLAELGEVGDDPERAQQLLERAGQWVDDGELNPLVLPVLEQLYGDLAAQASNSGQGSGDDGGGSGGDDGGGGGDDGGGDD